MSAGQDTSSASPKDDLSPRHHEWYEAFRSYIRHEDWLINARLSWNLTVQGFLFAGYGLLAQKVLEICSNDKGGTPPFVSVVWTMRVFPCVGFFVSALSLLGVYAAQKAIKGVNEKWQNKLRQNSKLCEFPDLTGGGTKWAHRLGFFQNYLPIVFMIAWIFIFYFSGRLTGCVQAPSDPQFHFR